MRKITFMILILITLLLIAACGGEPEPTEEAAPVVEASRTKVVEETEDLETGTAISETIPEATTVVVEGPDEGTGEPEEGTDRVTEITDERNGYYMMLGDPNSNPLTLKTGGTTECPLKWLRRWVFNVGIYISVSVDKKLDDIYPGFVSFGVGIKEGEEQYDVFLFSDNCQLQRSYSHADMILSPDTGSFAADFVGIYEITEEEFRDAYVGLGPPWNPIGPAPVEYSDEENGFFISLEEPTIEDDFLLNIGVLPSCQPPSVTRPIFNAGIFEAISEEKIDEDYPGVVTLNIGYLSSESEDEIDYNIYHYDDDCEIMEVYENGVDFVVGESIFGPDFTGTFEVTDDTFPDGNVGVGPGG